MSPEAIDALIAQTTPSGGDEDEELEEVEEEEEEEVEEEPARPRRSFQSRIRPQGPLLPPTRLGQRQPDGTEDAEPATPESDPRREKRAQEDERARMRERRAVQDFCYRCGTPFPRDLLNCPACGSEDREKGRARPRFEAPDDNVIFAPPWDLLPWPRQGSVALFGGPGSGKSTLAALIKPLVWITKEQDPKPVGAMFRRVIPGFMPEVIAVSNARQVAEALSTIERGPVVIDSLTAFGLKDALLAGHLLVNWVRDHNDRGLAILQVNKEGDAAGLMEIPHLVDAIIETSPDAWGVRAFQVRKSRWSSLDSRYWTFDAQGCVSMPTFDAAYSVEGGPGNYWLHPFPMKGAKWAGLLDELDEKHVMRPGIACAAMSASYMPHGFVTPQDTPERKRFAETHGLLWVTPEMAYEMLASAPPPLHLPPVDNTSELGDADPDNDGGDAPSTPSAGRRARQQRQRSS